ncbi:MULTISPECIES: DUF1488 domain-containing protein [Cedecea]|uniref:DUF1488 domain-containing protein n=1 Tax=Cedecea davisae DSM 4568 TaxID=566551 RepID=S3IJK3_9ENTR|nr:MULTISPECIES: DUF1488 domain-containing protein [Cedecea]EPF13240.1 hypothetical protein HMPREF0201_04249 [Cedecea davisae DSM 4568]QIX96141.1 DUF1488 domain-containing protein [Cedecea sp. FDAARGOS_727]SUX37476.1 Protein of uncharacterised function (DUF1488) [Cedecea davisae]
MNQAIQFPDREVWDESLQAICFPALVNGFQVNCAISAAAVATRFGGNSAQQWLALFRESRWDVEEEFETLIRSEQEDSQGWYWLS